MIKDLEQVKPYVNNRLIVDRQGYSIIFTTESASVVPFSCTVCDTALRTQDDEQTHEKFDCCYRCAVTWAYPNVAKWSEGWRPSRDEIVSELPLATTTRLTF